MKAVLGLCILWGLIAAGAAAADWPQWRYDAARSAATPEELPAELHLQWVRELGDPEPAWAGDLIMRRVSFDASYEPVVTGRTILVGSSRTDAVTAFDTRTGAEKWRFYADGPVRFAPVAFGNKVWFGSDDGGLYCLDVETGGLLRRFEAAPGDRKVLGNGRVISSWPVRGGPVLAGGKVYFAACSFPFMGVFIYALDAETGKVAWCNETAGSLYITNPHHTEALSGVAPQGYLVAAGQRLLVPCGRSRPACFDRRSGDLLYYRMGGHTGGSFAAATERLFLNSSYLYDAATGAPALCLPGPAEKTVLASGRAYVAPRGKGVVYFDLDDLAIAPLEEDFAPARFRRDPSRTIEARHLNPSVAMHALWLKAGPRLYATGGDGTVVMALDAADGSVQWQHDVADPVGSMLAADGRLFVVTSRGDLYCFGTERAEPWTFALPEPDAAPPDEWTRQAEAILSCSGVREGYALVLGAGDTRLLTELARQSALHVTAVESDAARRDAVRREMDRQGLYGSRVALLAGDPLASSVPAYAHSLVVVSEAETAGIIERGSFPQAVFQSLRPYGGVACLVGGTEEALRSLAVQSDFTGAQVRAEGGCAMLVRAGAPPGAGDWTHEDADPGRTRCSRDAMVRPPLGLLWFGGSAGFDDFFNTHAHALRPQVAAGRMVIRGPGALHAVDVYTGRLLWKAPLPELSDRGGHLVSSGSGERLTGGAYVTLADSVYVNSGGAILRLDAATGQRIARFPLAGGAGEAQPGWGYLAVDDDVLVAAVLRVARGRTALERILAPPEASRRLVALDRLSGEVRWSRDAEYSFVHNAIAVGGGKVFCVDRMPGPPAEGAPGGAPMLLALGLRTGRTAWSTTDDVFGEFLAYSAERDVLVQTTSAGFRVSDREPPRVIAYAGRNGEVLWEAEPGHRQPYILIADRLVPAMPPLNASESADEYCLLTGASRRWPGMHRGIGRVCSWMIAGEGVITYRSTTAAYSDPSGVGGIVNLGGFRSGCTENLIPAGGVLSAPVEFSYGCSCSFQIQTSLALIHDPDVETWSTDGSADEASGLGLNLGAPGDRLADDGTLWLDYPSVGGPSPYTMEASDTRDIKRRTTEIIRERNVVTVPAVPEIFCRHSLRLRGDGLKWVAASGAKGLRSLAMKLAPAGSYTVRLHFAEPEDLRPGERVFDVALQGEPVLKDFDIAKTAAGRLRAVVREFKGIMVVGTLRVDLAPSAGTPVLCGIEVRPDGAGGGD